MLVLKETASGIWVEDQKIENWLNVILFGGSKTGTITLGEGNYQVLVQSNSGVAVLSGSSLEVLDLKVNDSNLPVSVQGEISGNILTDVDDTSGHDIYYPTTDIAIKTNDSNSTFVDVDQSSEKEIIGQFGKLIIKYDGSYTYVIDSSKKPQIGAVDTFIYRIKDTVTGKTSEAKLNITINNKTVDHKTIDQDFIVKLDPNLGDTTQVLVAKSQVVVASVGAGIANVDIATFENAIEIDVAQGNLREVSFKAAGGAPIGLGAVSIGLEIYKLNEDTGLWQLYSNAEDWFTIVGVVIAYGASQKDLNFVLEPGKYKVLATSDTYGLAVLPTITLTPTSDVVKDYNKVADGQSVNGDVTTGELEAFKVIKVNGFAISDSTVVNGKFGKLIIKSDGTYEYVLNNDVNVNQLNVETFSIHFKNPLTGELSTSTLNIRIDASVNIEDIVHDVINVETNINYRTVDEVSLGLTSGSTTTKTFSVTGSPTKDDGFEYSKDITASATFTVNTTLRLNESRTMTYTIKDVNGAVVKNGVFLTSESVRTVNTVTVDGLKEGTYTIELATTGASLLIGNLDMKQTITEYLPKNTALVADVTGNIFAETSDSENVISLQIQNQITYTKFGDTKIIIQGDHGVLEMDRTGKYTYKPSKNSFGEDKFTLVTTTVTGSKDTTELVFGYSQSVKGDNNSNTVSSGGLDDTFVLGGGSDTLIFNLLKSKDANGGNGFDTWSDFTVGNVQTNSNADKIDVSALLSGANENNISSYISYDKVKGVISIDRDGAGNQYNPTELLNIGPQSSDLTLEQLLQNGQIIY